MKRTTDKTSSHLCYTYDAVTPISCFVGLELPSLLLCETP